MITPAVFREALTQLQRLDATCKVFGAEKHRYQRTLVSPSEMREFEWQLGVELPPEYRQFLLEVGHGAGPYYGIWTPKDSLAEINDLCDEYNHIGQEKAFPYFDFPLTADTVRAIKAKLAADDPHPWADHDWPCSGCIVISHRGCTFWIVLVLTGEFSGRVWEVANFEGFDGQWIPARRPAYGWWKYGFPMPQELPPLPTPPTFGQWFMGWAERCTTDLTDPRYNQPDATI